MSTTIKKLFNSLHFVAKFFLCFNWQSLWGVVMRKPINYTAPVTTTTNDKRVRVSTFYEEKKYRQNQHHQRPKKIYEHEMAENFNLALLFNIRKDRKDWVTQSSTESRVLASPLTYNLWKFSIENPFFMIIYALTSTKSILIFWHTPWNWRRRRKKKITTKTEINKMIRIEID